MRVAAPNFCWVGRSARLQAAQGIDAGMLYASWPPPQACRNHQHHPNHHAHQALETAKMKLQNTRRKEQRSLAKQAHQDQALELGTLVVDRVVGGLRRGGWGLVCGSALRRGGRLIIRRAWLLQTGPGVALQ